MTFFSPTKCGNIYSSVCASCGLCPWEALLTKQKEYEAERAEVQREYDVKVASANARQGDIILSIILYYPVCVAIWSVCMIQRDNIG